MSNEPDGIEVELEDPVQPPVAPAKPEDDKVVAAADTEVDVETPATPPADEPAAGEDPDLIDTRRRLEALEERTEERDVEAATERRQATERRFNEALTGVEGRLKENADKLKELKALKIKALEEGKTADQVELDDQIQDLKLDRAKLENSKAGISNTYQRFKRDAEAAAAAPAAPKYAKAGEWTKRNRWYGEKRFATETQYAELVDKQLMLEGVDPNSDDYYKQMDARLHARFKHLAPPKPNRNGPAGARPAPTGTPPAGTVNRGRVRLSAEDLDNMERFGLDKSNKAHQVEYARNKVAG